MLGNEDIYLTNLIKVISSRFNSIALSYERSASILEEEIKNLCDIEEDKNRIYYDNKSIINDVVLLRKKASMYRLAAKILIDSIPIIIMNRKKKIDKNKEVFEYIEYVANKESDIEKATDIILKILRSILNINIDKDRYYEISEHEARKFLENLCKH